MWDSLVKQRGNHFIGGSGLLANREELNESSDWFQVLSTSERRFDRAGLLLLDVVRSGWGADGLHGVSKVGNVCTANFTKFAASAQNNLTSKRTIVLTGFLFRNKLALAPFGARIETFSQIHVRGMKPEMGAHVHQNFVVFRSRETFDLAKKVLLGNFSMIRLDRAFVWDTRDKNKQIWCISRKWNEIFGTDFLPHLLADFKFWPRQGSQGYISMRACVCGTSNPGASYEFDDDVEHQVDGHVDGAGRVQHRTSFRIVVRKQIREQLRLNGPVVRWGGSTCRTSGSGNDYCALLSFCILVWIQSEGLQPVPVVVQGRPKGHKTDASRSECFLRVQIFVSVPIRIPHCVLISLLVDLVCMNWMFRLDICLTVEGLSCSFVCDVRLKWFVPLQTCHNEHL